jgi:twitching motility protein PilT
MQTMDGALADLYRKGIITREDAMTYAVDQEMLSKLLL